MSNWQWKVVSALYAAMAIVATVYLVANLHYGDIVWPLHYAVITLMILALLSEWVLGPHSSDENR